MSSLIRCLALQMPFDSHDKSGWNFSSRCAPHTSYVQVIVRAKKEGYSVAEVPIIFVDRIYGVSKLGPSEIISYLV